MPGTLTFVLFWSTIVGVLVGGAISLAAVWWVGPIVSRRQRNEQRREDALLELHRDVALTISEHVPLLVEVQRWPQRVQAAA
jgi:uncharacterized membrane protein YccC